MKRLPFITIILLMLFFGCEGDDDKNLEIEHSIFISDFDLITNTKEALVTRAKIQITGKDIPINNHGVIIYKDNNFIVAFEYGDLKEKRFDAIITTHLIKGEEYIIVPYIQVAAGENILGPPLTVVNNLEIQAKILSITPSQGFVYDTLYVKGEKFCEFSENSIRLGNFLHNAFYKSDTLVKAIINPFLNVSKSKVKLLTCGIEIISEDDFTITPPELDSLSSEKKYVNEPYRIYGKYFHSNFSKVWVNNTEVILNKEIQDIDKLEFTVPPNLPSGKLDMKIQVLDRVIEEKLAYQSTSPVINELDRLHTGFLDTLIIKGDYLLQRTSEIEVLVGNREQTILEKTDKEVKIVINNYFNDENPKLVLKTGGFELVENITMLPPEIISVDKDMYNLEDDVLILKTKYFLGYGENIKIGGAGINYSNSFESVDEFGFLKIHLNDWLNDFSFNGENNGEIKVEISTLYGMDSENIKIHPPVINTINNTDFYHTKVVNIKLEGNNLGNSHVSEIIIDGIELSYSASSFTMNNKYISFPVPEFLFPATHKLKIITGGQESNEIEFNILPLALNISAGLSSSSGTRKDVFTIQGSDINADAYFTVYANGMYCNSVPTSTGINFMLPHFGLLADNLEITVTYGPQTFDIGTLHGIEPYETVDNYVDNVENRKNSYFEYDGDLYIINAWGIYMYNMSSSTWETFEGNISGHEYYGNTRQIYTAGSKVYYSKRDNMVHVYDMENRGWDVIDVAVVEGEELINAIVADENTAYIFETSFQNGILFYEYDLVNKTKKELKQPSYQSSYYGSFVDEFYFYNNKIYFDVFDGDIMVYDILTDNWTNIGYPYEYKYRFFTNLYVHNDIVYLSGGEGNGIEYYDMYAYDFNTGMWTEKTYLPDHLQDHIIFGKDNKLYMTLGGGLYGYDQNEMYIYNIDQDPH